MKLRAISLWQPWASAIALGIKTIETRDWVSHYRGPLAIHAAQKKSRENRSAFEDLMEHREINAAFEDQFYGQLPFGQVLCLVRMRYCVTITKADLAPLSSTERLLGNWKPGRQAWALDNARRLRSPLLASGRQGFFWVNIPDKLLPPTKPGHCRLCGCTETTACVSLRGESCHWVEESLCSACADLGS